MIIRAAHLERAPGSTKDERSSVKHEPALLRALVRVRSGEDERTERPAARAGVVEAHERVRRHAGRGVGVQLARGDIERRA